MECLPFSDIYIYICSRLAQGKGSYPLKVLIKENKVIYQMHKSAKIGLVSYCHYISLTLLNSDPVE